MGGTIKSACCNYLIFLLFYFSILCVYVCAHIIVPYGDQKTICGSTFLLSRLKSGCLSWQQVPLSINQYFQLLFCVLTKYIISRQHKYLSNNMWTNVQKANVKCKITEKNLCLCSKTVFLFLFFYYEQLQFNHGIF